MQIFLSYEKLLKLPDRWNPNFDFHFGTLGPRIFFLLLWEGERQHLSWMNQVNARISLLGQKCLFYSSHMMEYILVSSVHQQPCFPFTPYHHKHKPGFGFTIIIYRYASAKHSIQDYLVKSLVVVTCQALPILLFSLSLTFFSQVWQLASYIHTEKRWRHVISPHLSARLAQAF